jgi:hypothetical protein
MAPRGVLNLMKSGKSLARAYDSNETIFPTRGPHDRYGHVYPLFPPTIRYGWWKTARQRDRSFSPKKMF